MAERRIVLSKELHVGGHPPTHVLLLGQSEAEPELLRQLEFRNDVEKLFSEQSHNIILKELEEATTNRQNFDDWLRSQPQGMPIMNRYGHPVPLAGHFLGSKSPVMIVGPSWLGDQRRERSVKQACEAGIPILAVGNGHYGLPRSPELWIGQTLKERPAEGYADGTCIMAPETMAFVPIEDDEVGLYSAKTGEFLDTLPYEYPNVFFYSANNAFVESYMSEENSRMDVTDFGTGHEELLAISLAIFLGFRDLILVGIPDRVYDPMLEQLCTRMSDYATWVTVLDKHDMEGAIRMSNKDFLSYVDYYLISSADVTTLKETYMRTPRHGGRLLKHRHLMEKYEALTESKHFGRFFDSPLLKGEVKKARGILDTEGCTDCELKVELGLLMDRFHTVHLSCDDPDKFIAMWKELFPEQNHYVIGGSKYVRGTGTGTAL